MDKYFERFLGLVESAEADLAPGEYCQLLKDISRVAGDKAIDRRMATHKALIAESDRLEGLVRKAAGAGRPGDVQRAEGIRVQ